MFIACNRDFHEDTVRRSVVTFLACSIAQDDVFTFSAEMVRR